ncbi:MAG: hypothetical protein KAG61_11335 [Bacteriovoracaceae bacterium]|nr:hypothetical protein [Bacteriovoracaceae bacterium]
MISKDLTKEVLYESVKTLVECDAQHIHLSQQKLFTLFSIAFQYMLFRSTKERGAYLIRIEDSHLAEKLARKSKDPSTRRFIETLLVPRKLKFKQSIFYLDFFHVGSWSHSNEIPKEKFKGAIVIKNTTSRPMEEVVDEEDVLMQSLPENYFYSSIQDIAPKSIIIAYDEEFADSTKVEFPFIKKEKDRPTHGVTISRDIDLDGID